MNELSDSHELKKQISSECVCGQNELTIQRYISGTSLEN